jgi:hypothetical protein
MTRKISSKELPHEMALEYMYSKRKKIICDKFKSFIKLIHCDGSVFSLENVLTEDKVFDNMDMLLVYTEHCGYFAFYKIDLHDWKEIKYE